jgi:RNA polymerase sigma factor (sigma-70 family)
MRGVMTYRGVVATEPGDVRDRFTGLFRQHYPQVLAYARRRVGADLAQEIVAETFLTAWRRFAEVPEPPLPWLYQVAAFEMANQARKRATQSRLVTRLERELGSEYWPTTAGSDEMAERAAVVGRAFSALRPADQEALRLAAWEGVSATDAGTVLGCSATAYRVRLHRARARLERAVKVLEAQRGGTSARVPVDPIVTKEEVQ